MRDLLAEKEAKEAAWWANYYAKQAAIEAQEQKRRDEMARIQAQQAQDEAEAARLASVEHERRIELAAAERAAWLLTDEALL